MSVKSLRIFAILGLVFSIFPVRNSSCAQNASVGSESGLDRAMQQNAVKNVGMEPDRTGKVSKGEENAYKALLAAQAAEPARRIQLGEEFAAKFPTSHYLPGVYAVLASSYFATGDSDKMLATGAKAVQLDPGNVDVMSLLAMAIPRRVKGSTPEGAQQLQTAEAYAHRAIEMIPAMPKPPAISDADFEKIKNDKLALAHSGLGLIDSQHSKYEEARAEFTQAVQLASSPDPVDYYLLGNADMKAGYYHGAIDAYEKCAASGPIVTECRNRADSTRKDLPTFISKD